MNKSELIGSMKQDSTAAHEEHEELEKAREKLNSWPKENIQKGLQFPHILDINITDAAFEKIPDHTSTEFYLFNESIKALDYMCLRGGDAEEGNKALKTVLDKLSGPHTEDDMVRIQALITNLQEITKEELERNPVTPSEAQPWQVENKDRAAVFDPAIRKFNNSIKNSSYQPQRSDYSR